ncbi:MAG: pyruvate, phosphate dikinase [Candidatus Omnitrophica bacterium]|nr:pyruvate, phosphate dikinase [Candidatus Omnitrophota bacterium]
MAGNSKKYIYAFGGGKADGDESMKNLLGGKGANLAAMAGHPKLKLPVPPGYTVTTDVCTYYYQNKKTYPKGMREEAAKAMARVEKLMGKSFGDPKNPLLVSVRSGARKSMPGMMETVLNVGLTEKTIPGLVALTGNERFVYDAYRRLIMMYSDVVMEKAAGIEPEEGMGIRKQLENILGDMKEKKGYKSDTDMKVADLKKLCDMFKVRIKDVLGKDFPDDPQDQLWGGIGAVFASWNGKRAVSYRKIEGIPDEWGTAVNVQAMVFGNMGNDSATGVAFTRDPGNGENKFYGEYLVNAQGEDVVAGIRTPGPINAESKSEHNKDLKTLEEIMPKAYKELFDIQRRLEEHYRDMQDIEFTIEKGRLFMLQCRIGKRNGTAAVRIAVDMVKEKLISKEEATLRVTPAQIDELLHPMVDPSAEKGARPVARGLPAGPGGGVGMAVFTSDTAEAWAREGKQVVLVREETSPEDVHGMHSSQGVLTSKGGMTSHAALVARGWGKCCIVGCAAIHIDSESRTFSVGNTTVKEGEWVTLNGTKGNVYAAKLPLVEPDMEHDKYFKAFMKICDEVRRLKVRTNADRPDDATTARKFGAQGIGLCRTEHMFFDPARIKSMRKMIVAETVADREKALAEILPYQREDFIGILKAMEGLPVIIRLLDPPLHEFLPKEDDKKKELAAELGITLEKLESRIDKLHELNPMLGHRGCRLGITYPEITRMQVQAVFEAAAELTRNKVKVFPEVMVPIVGSQAEIRDQYDIIKAKAEEVQKKYNVKLHYMIGTMIEIPRAALVADKIAEVAEFFSFGTNDLTQMTFGFSRDDIGGFLPDYLDKKVLPKDPFQTIDREGVGQLIAMGIQRGRSTRKGLEVGICGEHGGDPDSIKFCHSVGMDYVSCSPYRVPIARLAAAQAVAEEKGKKKK